MAGYIGSKVAVVSSGAERKKVFTATSGQTSFTGLSYTVNNVHVFQNGVRLVDGTDYTATNGNSITLTVGAATDDQVVVVSYNTFQTSDTVSASTGGTFAGDVNFTGAFTSQGIDDNATSTAMTLDGSGNLLVGKTTQGLTNAGFEVAQSGQASITQSGASALRLNRLSSDGELLQFRKDGSTVGSIGTSSSRLHIENGDTGLRIAGDLDQIFPCGSGGGDRDAAIDLGSTGVRFKDLYLSGSIEIENGTGNVGVGKNALAVNTADYNTAVGWYAGNAVTGGYNTFVGAYSGGLVSTGTNNTILGRFSGNQGGLDIRTSSNNIVLSDGDGNWRIYTTSDGSTRGGQTPNYRGSSDDGQGSWQLGSNGNVVAATYADIALIINRMGSDGTVASIRNSGSQVGTISVSGSSTAYNTSSDHRLKENVVELTGATDRLKQLNPSRFNFITDADTTVDGFFAHEVQSVFPEAITGTHNEVDDDGNPVYQGIDQSKLVPLLVATIKELEARITALENA